MGAECSVCGHDMYDECDYCAHTAERDEWIQRFNRLEAAIAHHKRDTAGFESTADDSLYAARDRILRDAAK